MALFFCPSSNTWVSSGCSATFPKPNPPGNYPVFDPTKNTWIPSGNYGVVAPIKVPYFSNIANAWVSS